MEDPYWEAERICEETLEDLTNQNASFQEAVEKLEKLISDMKTNVYSWAYAEVIALIKFCHHQITTPADEKSLSELTKMFAQIVNERVYKELPRALHDVWVNYFSSFKEDRRSPGECVDHRLSKGGILSHSVDA